MPPKSSSVSKRSIPKLLPASIKQPPIVAKIRKQRKQATPPARTPLILDAVELDCQDHPGNVKEFLCLNQECYTELCSHCVLFTHKHHIDEIKMISDLVSQFMNLENFQMGEKIHRTLAAFQKRNLVKLELVSRRIVDKIQSKVQNIKKKVVEKDFRTLEYFNNTLKNALNISENLQSSKGISFASFMNFVSLLKKKKYGSISQLFVEKNIIITQFEKMLSNFLCVASEAISMNSTHRKIPKLLHWINWEEQIIHLFDVVNNRYRAVEINKNFSVPNNSRSIMVPNGEIFIFGGQEPTFGRREVFCAKIHERFNEALMKKRTNMPIRKYDFALCYLKDNIYTIGGMSVGLDILDACDRYSIQTNSWTSMARTLRKRHSATAVSIAESNRIVLFGGFFEGNSRTTHTFEVFDVAANKWSNLFIKNPADFQHFEFSGGVQVEVGKILIFGGSESRVHDTTASYYLHYDNNLIEKLPPLKKAHVFFNPPFVFGNQVLAIGSEYFVKQRNVHRFKVDTCEWDILF